MLVSREQVVKEARALIIRFGEAYHADDPGALAEDVCARLLHPENEQASASIPTTEEKTTRTNIAGDVAPLTHTQPMTPETAISSGWADAEYTDDD